MGLRGFRTVEHNFCKHFRHFRKDERIIRIDLRGFRDASRIFCNPLRNSCSAEPMAQQLGRLHQSGGKKQFEGRRKSGFIERKSTIV